MPRLPVSGLTATPREPDGADDLALVEARGHAVTRALEVLPRLLPIESDLNPADVWPTLTVTDFEYALLALRSHFFGEEIACKLDCPHCGAPVELSFHAADFAAASRPAQPRGIRSDPDRPGWFRLEDVAAAFRLPTVRDQAEVLGDADGARRLTQICIEPADAPARLRGRIERAMERLAPELSRDVEGACPSCGGKVAGTIHVPFLVMEDLRRAATGVHDDVHRIASAYGWSEAEILALPRVRRRQYADRIRRLVDGAS